MAKKIKKKKKSKSSRSKSNFATIDLRKLRKPLLSFLQKSCEDFAAEHPQSEIVTVALCPYPYGCDGEGEAGICFNEAEQVAAWEKDHPDWLEHDEHGPYNDSPDDYTHAFCSTFFFKPMLDLYDKDGAIEFYDLDSDDLQVVEWDGADEVFNELIFPAVCKVMEESKAWSTLKKADTFRIGVIMHGSQFKRLWVAS